MKLNGSQILIECLKEQGVDTVFGYPGGAILNIYDELYKHSSEINHVLTSHEQGASHAADGYARATGRVGVCLATSGPGATNLVTGIATAYMDSIPLVAITANVGVSLLGRDSFQEIDISGVTMPITKHNFIVKDVTQMAETLRSAFRIAREGRPGPVLVDITKNASADVCDYVPVRPDEVLPTDIGMKMSDIEKAVKMIKKAKRPMIFVGGGAATANAQESLKQFVDLVDAPVCDTLMGKGTFNGTDPRYIGMLGMHGTKAANLGVSRCDLLITVGARFSDRITSNTKTFAKKAQIIHIDVDAAEINKNVTVDCSIIGDADLVLKRLNAALPQLSHSEWVQEIEDIQNRHPLSYDRERALTGPAVIEELYRITDGDALVCTDVGQHQMWAAQYYKYKEPHQLLTSGGLGTMGYGLGAAIGAKYGRPEKVVVNVAGDGCFRMNMNELATASRYNVPVIEIVINNHVLGMVRQWQTLFYERRYAATILDDKADFCKVAEGLGCKAYRAETREEFARALEEAIASNAPCLIDCQIDLDDKVFPMVPSGKPIAEVFDQDDLSAQK